MEHRRLKHTEASYMAHKEEEGELSESVPSKITYPHDSNSYRIIDEIGNGMRAVVYKAECIPMNSTLVAIKSIDLDQSRADFENVRRESKMMTLLSHQNILRAHCSFIVDRRLWVVMPFMSSGSLQSIVASSFPDGLTEPCIAIVLRETLKALCYLHDQGHLHRDIKAGNILIDSDGSIKLADFGVSASIYESNLTHGSISISPSSCVKFTDVAGTPYWMAPEVIHSHTGYSLKADIWSFGITALELAHGRPPLSHLPPSKSLIMKFTKRFRFSDYDKLRQDKNKKFSKSFKEMVKSCLEQDPSKRPTPEKLLKHVFFKNCKSCQYLVKNVLKGLPTVEQRFTDTKLRRLASINKSSEEEQEEEEYENHEDGRKGLLSLTKNRRISGWNLNVDELELVPVFPTEICDNNVAVEQVQYVDDKAIIVQENETFGVPKSRLASDKMIHVPAQVMEAFGVKENETNHQDDKYINTNYATQDNNNITKALELEESLNQIIAQDHQAHESDVNSVIVAKNGTILNGLMSLKRSLDKQRKNVMLMIGMLGGDESTLQRNQEEQMELVIERLMNELDKEKHKNFELELELEYFKLHFSGSSNTDRLNMNCM